MKEKIDIETVPVQDLKLDEPHLTITTAGTIEVAKPSIEVVRSGLTSSQEEELYLKLKGEGKCCEGGEEGWTG